MNIIVTCDSICNDFNIFYSDNFHLLCISQREKSEMCQDMLEFVKEIRE